MTEGLQTRCRNGHLRTEENTYRTKDGSRRCYDCMKARTREYKNSKHVPKTRAKSEACRKGHAWTEENTSWCKKRGKMVRRCRTCQNAGKRSRHKPNPKIRETCVNGHAFIPENRVPGANGRGSECRVCRKNREASRVRKVCDHPGLACDLRTDSIGRTRCYTRFSTTPNPLKRGKPKPDGWEDEFGPVPARISNRVWVDRVVLARTLASEDAGRALTSAETRALHLLSVMRQGRTEGLESGIRMNSERHGNTFRVKGVKIA